MGQTTFANSRGIAHKGSGGMSTVFPDVCKTPAPPRADSDSLPEHRPVLGHVQGPTTVKTDGQMPMVKGAYSRSSGDEAGTLGGVVSSVNMNVCEYMLYSFDVKFEGKNVCRLGDPLFHNKKNIMG